ncbi:uncharacterized protein [Typha angustifolia]|uniref:uncharacterized protein n=1 Tax=Typha angustifolia TaxID=59011 RepID=UPI003C2F50EB
MAAKAEEPPPSPLPAAGNVASGDPVRDPLPQSAGDISSSPLEKRTAPYADAEEKRGDDDEPHEAKRRRTCPAALEKISAAAAAAAAAAVADDDEESRSFSFQARSIAPIEMTPKFGSFNSLAILEDTSPSPAAEEEVEKREGSDDEGKDGN